MSIVQSTIAKIKTLNDWQQRTLKRLHHWLTSRRNLLQNYMKRQSWRYYSIGRQETWRTITVSHYVCVMLQANRSTKTNYTRRWRTSWLTAASLAIMRTPCQSNLAMS